MTEKLPQKQTKQNEETEVVNCDFCDYATGEDYYIAK